MATRTASSSRRGASGRAVAAVLVGVLSLAGVPGGIEAHRALHSITLAVGVGAGAAAGGVLGLVAILFARGARREIEWALGRIGGERTARAGRLLGVLGLLIAITAGLALGVYGVLLAYG